MKRAFLFVPMFALFMLLPLGCSVNPGKNPDPVDVEGNVSIAGKALSTGTLSLQPTAKGSQAALVVTNGKVRGTITPGKYTYYITAAATEAELEAIPEKYRAGSMDRQIEIKAAGNVDFVFN